MKTILLITSEFPTKVSTFVTRDMEALVSGGYCIDLYALYPENKEQFQFVPQEGQKLIEEKKVSLNHISYMQMIVSLFFFWNYFSLSFFKEAKVILNESKHFGKVQWKKSLYTIIWTIALLNITKKSRYEKVISYWGNYSATAAYLFSKYNKYKPSFYTYLHAGVDLYRDQIYLFEKLAYATKIFTVCQFNVEFLKQLFEDKFQTIKNKIIVYHLPLRLKPFSQVSKEHNKIIAVGSLVKRKGVDYLLHACKILDDKNIPFTLSIVGDGEERESLKILADELGIAEKVSFLGHLPYSDVEKQMASSVVLAHCSPELGDAVPTVIKESLSLGTPVVGSNIVGIPELLDYGNCGALFEPKNSESLALALENVLNNKEKQVEMAHLGRKFAEKMFDFDKNKNVLLRGLE